ncbi:hypothetical protein CCYA_CCYA16G4139 [Cyanidiococcus yangmingshanensis]|nr:hypothetical protein CCYA_CCYA16G4139 [Cyanidiococcus yangmingshanensis]
MVVVLVLGDAYVPQRRPGFDASVLDYIRHRQPDLILCTGNLGSPAVSRFFERQTRTFYSVRGESDALEAPERLILRIHDFTIGMLHGYQLASNIAASGGSFLMDPFALRLIGADMGVDILVAGGASSPQVECFDTNTFALKPRAILQPGSITAAVPFPYTSQLQADPDIGIKAPLEPELSTKKYNIASREGRGYPAMVLMDIEQNVAEICSVTFRVDKDASVCIGEKRRVHLFAP